MDFGVILVVLALGVLVLVVGGRYGTSCRACKTKTSSRQSTN